MADTTKGRTPTSDPPTTGAGDSLGGRTLGLTDVIAQALGAVGPVFGALTFLPLIAGGAAGGSGAGGAIPLSVLLSAAAVFGVGWTLSRFARRMRTSGSVYDYIARAFGDRVGTAFGATYYLVMLGGVATTPLIFGGYVADLLAATLGITVPWWITSLAFIAAVAVVLALGVSISTRAQLTLTLISIAAVVAFCVYVIARTGGSGTVSMSAPLKPTTSPHGWLGIGWGMMYGLFIFSGFETAGNLAEETPNPRRSVPRAMLITVALLAVFHLLVSYATVLGFRLDGAAIAREPIPLLTLAGQGRFGAPWLAHTLTAMILIDIFALTVAVCVGGSRGLFALGRDGRLPAAFAKVSRKRSIPLLGVAVPVAWCAFVVILVHATGGLLPSEAHVPEYMPVFSWLGGVNGISVALSWGALCLGGLWWLARRDSRPLPLYVAAGLGLLAGAGVMFASLYDADAATQSAAVVVFAIVVIFLLHSTVQRRRGRFRTSAANSVPHDDQ